MYIFIILPLCLLWKYIAKKCLTLHAKLLYIYTNVHTHGTEPTTSGSIHSNSTKSMVTYVLCRYFQEDGSSSASSFLPTYRQSCCTCTACVLTTILYRSFNVVYYSCLYVQQKCLFTNTVFHNFSDKFACICSVVPWSSNLPFAATRYGE